MKLAAKLACLTVLAGLAACGPDNGYYDSRGNYHWSGAHDDNGYYARDTYGNTYGHDKGGRDDNYYVDNSAVPGDSARVPGYDHRRDPEVRPYTRAGYYDYSGEYVPYSEAPAVPRAYMPPRGKCRIWFTDRAATDQPPVESCAGIRYRVPADAYVVYGG